MSRLALLGPSKIWILTFFCGNLSVVSRSITSMTRAPSAAQIDRYSAAAASNAGVLLSGMNVSVTRVACASAGAVAMIRAAASAPPSPFVKMDSSNACLANGPTAPRTAATSSHENRWGAGSSWRLAIGSPFFHDDDRNIYVVPTYD